MESINDPQLKDVVLTGHCIRHTNRRKYINFIINQTKIIYFLIEKAKKYSDCKTTKLSEPLFPDFFSTESIPFQDNRTKFRSNHFLFLWRKNFFVPNNSFLNTY